MLRGKHAKGRVAKARLPSALRVAIAMEKAHQFFGLYSMPPTGGDLLPEICELLPLEEFRDIAIFYSVLSNWTVLEK
jgi:hypothetical protein